MYTVCMFSILLYFTTGQFWSYLQEELMQLPREQRTNIEE